MNEELLVVADSDAAFVAVVGLGCWPEVSPVVELHVVITLTTAGAVAAAAAEREMQVVVGKLAVVVAAGRKDEVGMTKHGIHYDHRGFQSG